MGLPLYPSTQRALKNPYRVKWRVTVVQDHSRSFKVIEICTNWKPICDFLLVFHCIHIYLLYCFWDISTYLSKISVLFAVFTHLYLIGSPSKSCCPANSTKFGLKEPECLAKRWWNLRDPAVISFESIPTSGRQTDTSLIAKSRSIIAERDDKKDQIAVAMNEWLPRISWWILIL